MQLGKSKENNVSMPKPYKGCDFVAKLIRDIQMGDYTISLKETREGLYEARLTSGEFGRLLEVEKLEDGKVRIKEMDIGSSILSIEQLAFMCVLTEIDEDLIKEMARIKKERSKNQNI